MLNKPDVIGSGNIGDVVDAVGQLAPNETVKITKSTKRAIRANFSRTLCFTNADPKRKSNMEPDLLDRLVQVSKGAIVAFNNLKFNRDEDDNVTKYVPEEVMSTNDRVNLSRWLRELKDVGLVRSLKKRIPALKKNQPFFFEDWRTTYILNPNIIRCDDEDLGEYLWDRCEVVK